MGGLLAFRVGNYNTTAEREQFRFLCEQLKAHYENSNEFCVLVGNYNIGCELDALFIKKDAIIVIEFKNYGGNVIANENGDWTCNGKVIKGGSRKTVLQQARINHSIVKKELKVLGVSKENIKDVPTLVIFNQPIEITNNLSATNKSWLHITDNDHFIEKLDDITCPRTDFDSLGIVNLAEVLNLNSFYLPEFSNATYDKLVKQHENQNLNIEKDCNHEFLKADNVENNDEEVHDLHAFIERILKQILKQEDFIIRIYHYYEAQTLLSSLNLSISHEYLIAVEADGIGSFCPKLSRFINHEVRAVNSNIVYWEDGEQISDTSKSKEETTIEDKTSSLTIDQQKTVSFRKSKTILPHWIDKKIFHEHNAIYAPEHERYEYNLDLNDEELKVYLGTYFPRSYAEMFCIVDNLMQNKNFAEIIQTEEQINVFDCGCGTGGEILGLITALAKHLPQVNINVTAIDGNEGALAILKELIESIPSRNVHAQINTLVQTFNTNADLVKLDNGKKNYHFMLCDKMVCELISKKVLPNDAYAIMAKMLASHLHENGLLIMLDVTTKDEHTGLFYPQLMNKSINEYVRKSKTIETLLPLSCACNERCKDLCFMQQTFYVSHSHKTADESRVCYRVLCRKALKEKVMQNIKIDGFAHIIHPINYKLNKESAICAKSVNNIIEIDTFNLNL